MKYLYGCAHEQFPPDECLGQAVAAERAATQFALMNCSGADPRGAIEFYKDSVLPRLD